MNEAANRADDAGEPIAQGITLRKSRVRLFRKYFALLVAVVSIATLATGAFEVWFSYREHKATLISLQREQAEAAAGKIGQFFKEIEGQIGWTAQLPWMAAVSEQRRFDAQRLLRQVPAISELTQIDATGRERLRVSRVDPDVVDSQVDWSADAKFVGAVARKIHYGPVYFRFESEPYVTIAMAGTLREAGVSIAEVNLKFIWDVVTQIKVGEHGQAYVVDAEGRLVAHPDISLVLRNSDLSGLAQVQAARAAGTGALPESVQVTKDIQGRRVLTAYAPIASLGWLMFVELPIDEAYAPIYASLLATGLVLLVGLALAVLASLLLTRTMVAPIRALQHSAARIGAGELEHRIGISTGDELETLGDQFNDMAARLQESHATLERKVEERTHQLELANLAKSRFLAAASHDLRQPLHALGLFVAQLQDDADPTERRRVVSQIDAAIAAMNQLFNALLDISKLDAGVLVPNVADFPLAPLLKQIEATFAQAAREKDLRLRVRPSSAWIRSDAILLERVLLNLVSNAVRYTAQGGVVIGCRRRGDVVRVEVWDSGIGIPDDQRQNIFGEFYRLSDRQQDSGLGLGLAIVDRLCRLLEHPIELTSTLGRGSRFTVVVPAAVARPQLAKYPSLPPRRADPPRGKLIVVVDDDALVLDGMRGLLRGWGCRVVTAATDDAALEALAAHDGRPDLIISDYQLAGGKTGIETIERMRGAFRVAIPAFLISGDTAPERLWEASASGYHLLHKPVEPMTLRAMVSELLRQRDAMSTS